MGKIDYDKGLYESAQGRFISAGQVFLKIVKIRDAIEAYLYLGMTSYKLNYYSSSLNFYKQCEKLINEYGIEDDDVLARIYFNISLCYSMQGNYTSNIDYILLAMEKLKKKNDRLQYGKSLLMLSMSYYNLDKYDDALMYADKAIQIFKELENLMFLAEVETDIGIILSDIGNFDESFRHLQNACRIKTETEDKTLVHTMLCQAESYIKTNDVDKALNIVNDAYERCIEDGLHEYRPRIFRLLYNIYIIKGDAVNAELYLLEGIKYLENSNMRKELADIYALLGEYYEVQDNKEDALKYFSKSIVIYKDLKII
jgi:tetratricopeptide (TPR) repeat protein